MGRTLGFGDGALAELNDFCSSIVSSIVGIFKLEKKKDHGTRDHRTLVAITDLPLLSHAPPDETPSFPLD